jgi:hypothetical protein
VKFARIACNSPDGIMPRLVVVQPEQQRVIDLATAERLRLERQGATLEAAVRLATALFPASMTAALSLGDLFLPSARRTVEAASQEAMLPLDDLHWLSPLDPPLLRDFTGFEQHVRSMSAREGRPVFKEFYQMPLYFKISPLGLIGHEQEVS